MERGNSRFEQAKSELEALQSSREAYKKRCTEDAAFALLANIESDIPPHTGANDLVVITPCHEHLEAAEMKLDAHKTALAKLNADLAGAEEGHSRAVSAVNQLIAAIIGITLERRASAAIEAQEAAWRAMDFLCAGLELADKEHPGGTEALQRHVIERTNRYSAAVADGHALVNPKHDPADWNRFQAAKSASHIPAWRAFLEALTQDASAQLETTFKEVFNE